MTRITEFLSDNLTQLISTFVDNPNEIKVTVTTSTKTIICQIKALREDYGKIIGRKGKTIESIRVIAAAIKNTHFTNDLRKVSLEILDDDIPSYSRKS